MYYYLKFGSLQLEIVQKHCQFEDYTLLTWQTLVFWIEIVPEVFNRYLSLNYLCLVVLY